MTSAVASEPASASPPARSPGFARRLRGSRIDVSAFDAACCLYLLLPVVIFLAFFAAPAIAVAGLACLLFVGARLRIVPAARACAGSSRRNAALAFAAFVLAMLTGIFPPFNLAWDWLKHYSIYRLLIEQDWPIVLNDGSETLRYYLGFYLAPALMAKALGAWAADGLLFAWLWLGMYLVLRLLTAGLHTGRAASVVAVFIAFGGADVIGSWIWHPEIGFGRHLEWWSDFVSFTSHLSMVVWVPQHAIPGWIAALLLLRGSAASTTLAAPILVAAGFWSAFVAVGLIPFFLLRAFEAKRWAALFSLENILVGAVVGIPIAAYLLHDAAALGAGVLWQGNAQFSWARLGIFYLFEFLAIAVWIAAIGVRQRAWYWLSIAILVLFPLFWIGRSSDFAMRATVPALAIFVFLTAEILTTSRLSRTFGVVVLLCVGAVGPVSDLVGLLRSKNTAYIKSLSFDRFLARYPPGVRHQYLARYPHWTLR